MKWAAARCVAISIALSIALAPVSAHAWVVNTSARDAASIQAKWAQVKPDYAGPAYVTAPRTTAPFAAGELQPQFLDDGLRAVNFMRFLAGLPDDVALSADYTNRDQHGSVINAANGVLAHAPTQPAGMTDAFYTLGRSGTSASNLAWGPSDLEGAVRLYMSDSDASNIAHLGHRRWILDPPMAATGFGFASGSAGNFSSLYAFDKSRSEQVDYDVVTWPSSGAFPIEYFSAGTAWSATINPSKYSVNASALRITLRRDSDGRTWTFTPADTPTGAPGDGEYFSYSTAGYGVPSAVIFRPPLDVAYAPGASFDVTIAAGVTSRATGSPVELAYRTTFMSLSAVPLAPTSLALVAPAKVTYGSRYPLTATLRRSTGESLPGKIVTFEASIDGGRTWRAVGGASTDASGAAAISWLATGTRASMRLRARWAGDAALMAAQQTAAVAVRPYVSISPPTSAVRGTAFSVTGYLKPRHGVGTYPASVKCYRRINGVWVYKSSFRAKVVSNSTTSSRVRASVTLPAGTWQLKLYHAADAYHIAGYSTGKTVAVR